MSLRGLLEWGLVRREHRRGDRKEYFLAEQDVWKVFRAIAEQRKRREIDPLVRELEEIRRPTEPSANEEHARGTRGRLDAQTAAIARHQQRIDDLVGFFQLIEAISKRVLEPDASRLRAAAQMLETAS